MTLTPLIGRIFLNRVVRRTKVWLNVARNQERVVTQRQHIRSSAQTARAVAIQRTQAMSAALTTLILSVLLGLLSGAVWMHAT
jgi:hypothetical protein